ncbi:NAD-dependent epimerase/dehydratase family protein [Nocardia sp. NPDC005366]|uniref:NAD-dependent epimerase/dehydratase family protein n=1 Tax=Nocardia sp. NPDC005366 TaxID=3156878 RepID=UPI0033A767B3
MSDNTVLVTGAFGQVGTFCVDILLGRGKKVIALDLRNDRTVAVARDLSGRARPGALVPAYVDLLDAAAVADLVAEHRPAVIVHLAAIVAPLSYRDPGRARKVNVGGTEHVLVAAAALDEPPLFIQASSAAVYGSRNPYHYPERITPDTPVDPIDHYGEDKVLAETAVRDSGLPHAVLRLGGVISPAGASTLGGDYLLLMRATPVDNRIHAVDGRDVGLAFANAVDRGDRVDGRTLLIAGNDTYTHRQRDLEDDMMQAAGLGRLGPSAGLPGDPDDDRGWSFTGWFDTTESEALLGFQRHDWPDTVSWIADSMGRRRVLARALGPVLRPAIRFALSVQRRREGRGPYADPWTLIEKKYGPDVLASTTV